MHQNSKPMKMTDPDLKRFKISKPSITQKLVALIGLLIVVTHPLRTTMKSMTFQPFLRYEPLWNTNPKAMIFIPASKQNIPIK